MALDYHRNTFAFFGQDDIRVSNRLTLNLGLRYELFMPVTAGRTSKGRSISEPTRIVVPKGQTAQLTPTSLRSCPLQATASPGLISPDYNDFAPRVGLAFKAD